MKPLAVTPMSARCPWLPALILAPFLAWACAEAPNAPVGRPSTPSLATATGAVACERSWTSATSGAWEDSTRWTPAIVPTPSDLVCFAASGTYSVTGAGAARRVHFTSGANVTFTHTPGTGSYVAADSLTMQPTSRVTFAQCAVLFVDHVIVDGTLELDRDPSTCTFGNDPHEIFLLVNNGWLELDSAAIQPPYQHDESNLENRGIVNVRTESSIDLGSGYAWLQAGSVFGAGGLTIAGDQTSSSEVWWSGTRLPPRSAPTSSALVFVRADRLVLTDSTTFGALDASVHDVDGDIGSQMDVTLSGPATDLSWDFLNSGTLALLSNWVTTLSGGRIVNYGAIRALSGTPYQFLNATVENHGVIEVTGELTLSQGVSAYYVANFGSVVVRPGGLLKLGNAEFEQQPTGTVSGIIEALGPGAIVSGTGSLPSVRIDSGATLAPGKSWGDDGGTLTFDTLVVSPGAITSMYLGDPAVEPSDRVHINRSLSLDGTLELKTDPAYTGGVCGQVASLLTLAKTAAVTGSFASVTGRQLDSARAWRLVPGTTSYRVAGFDPRTRLSVAPAALAVAEGGSAATANVCLGSPAPSASVTVSPTPRMGQVSATPSPITFLTSNWELPQPLSVSAIDDVRAEGPHVDSVAFAMTSADPVYRGTAQQQLHVDVTDNDPGVDLALSLVSAPATAVVGGLADLRFRVTNAGPGNSTGATFTLRPMAGLTLDSHSPSVSCTQGSGVLTCTVGALATGATVDFILFLRATAAGSYTNTARLAGRDFDPALGNNTLAWVVSIS